jgi:PD-(D/E)XK nuclease superfamily
MRIGDDGSIHVRQSDLEAFNRCNERHRLILRQEHMASNDAAVSGTCAHAGVAAVLSKDIEPNQVEQWTYDYALRYCADHTVRWVDWTLPTHIAEHAARCAVGFVRELLPLVEPGGLVEATFDIPFMTFKDRDVYLTGTCDYVPPSHVTIDDWKTSSRRFDQRVKQRTAIQPTVYATAAVHGAFGEPYEWPVTFRYGVMVRGREKATTQIVNVQRTHAHEGWLRDQLFGYLNVLTLFGMDTPWPRDEDHYLCNQKWCPVWSMCKGARLSEDEDNWTH